MDKDLSLCRLYQLYGNMLTEHQKDIFDLYYDFDLSLGEIAEIKGASRQSVNDALKKTREALLEFEDKIGFDKKLGEIRKAAEKTGGPLAEEILKILEEL